MNRGMSPIVSVILLVAISVLTSVAIWFWVSPMTSKPSGLPQTDSTNMEAYVQFCDAAGKVVSITNKGTRTIPENTILQILNGTNGEYTGCFLNVTPSLGVGANTIKAVMPQTCTSMRQGAYYILRKSGYLDSYFAC